MILRNKSKILNVLRSGTLREKANALEKIWEARDISLINILLERLEKEQSQKLKEQILLLLLERLIPLSELNDEDISSYITKLLSLSELFTCSELIEMSRRLDMSNYKRLIIERRC